MPFENVKEGYVSVYRMMGMEKQASISTGLKRVGGVLKRLAIGEPGKFVKEVKGGKVWAPGSTIRSMFAIPSFKKHPIKASLMGGLFYGLPAYQAYQIASDDEPNKGSRLGGMLGGTALGWAALGPGGMLASIPAGMAGEWAGGKIGKGFDRISGGDRQKIVTPTAPGNYRQWQSREAAPLRTSQYHRQLQQHRPLTDPRQWEARYNR